jgi:UDP-2,3-diacylglucosamine pyrophosphatase LpxH
MNIEANVLFEDVVEDADLESVHHTLSCAVNEWFFPELTRQQPRIEVAWTPNEFPIFCVSDLHLGDGGPRDNFAHMSGGKREAEFNNFLDYVEEQQGQLFILGDLFELWQGNVSKVITYRIELLDRLAQWPGGGARYILGNHDADLTYFVGHGCQLDHPFFQLILFGCAKRINGRKFYFIHGHQADPYCKGDTPGFGRIAAIYAGLKEDRNGGPLWNKYKTVEEHSIGRLERWSSILRRLIGKPGRFKAMNLELCQIRSNHECDVIVSGHTHRAGQLWSKSGLDWGLLPIYNTGTWAEQVCSFVVINNQGQVGVFDWANGKPVPNQTRLTV